MKFIAFVKAHLALVSASIVVGISAITIGIVLVMQSSNEEAISILEAGADTVPIIKQEDLDLLGRTYSILNEQFEREINELTTGEANRHNKMDKVLTHYGVYGKENADPFKNDDYVNGIRISYDKTSASYYDGKSNFNDIISVMSVLYEQKMDLVPIEELEETFTRLFWLSHTYTYNSDELYPCRHGCLAENNYHCTEVYKDYRGTRYLKYELYTVPYHEEYADLGYDEREHFRIVLPKHMCTVHNQRGAGCIWDEEKVCYHGSGCVNFADYNDKKSVKKKTVTSEDGEREERKFEGPVYADLGEIVIPEDIDAEFLGPEPTIPTGEPDEELEPGAVTYGNRIAANDSSCHYYMEVKYCSERKRLSDKIATLLKEIDDIDDSINGAEDGADTSGLEEQKIAKEEKERELREELNEHKTNVCEANEAKAKSWCNGFKICLGHKDHYKCDGKHKVILCSGHTNINVEIKVMYNKELLDEALKVFR